VWKEGPPVDSRNGMIMLSEDTGAHEAIGGTAVTVIPFDVQEQADAIYTALTASSSERAERMRAMREIITARSPVDWIDDQLSDIEAKRAATPTR